MAGVSKVTYGDEVLLDLTQDTVNPNVLLSGFTAHAANGDQIGGALVLGALAYLDSISYNSNYLTDKPHLGALASRDFIEWSSSFLTNKPDFHKLAFQDFIDYESDQLRNKPVFGNLAWLNKISYESDLLTDKPTSLNEVINWLCSVYPDMPKGIKLFGALGSNAFYYDDLLYYADEGMHVRDQYLDWFSYDGYGIRITIKDRLSDVVKPILGDLAYRDFIEWSSPFITNKPDFHKLAFQDFIDYESNQLKNKPEFGDLAFQDLIDYDSDQIINKPPTADVILNAILDIYPDIPIGIPFAVNAAAQGAFSFPEGVFSYMDEGIRFDPANASDISSDYISADNGVCFIFPPLQFISDVPDDDKVYARRHGEWVEITM